MNVEVPATAAPAVSTPAPAVDKVESNTEPTETKVEEAKPDEASQDVGSEKKEALEEVPKDDKFASKFAALTRRERQLLLKEKELKAKEDRISAFETKKAKAKDNPIEWLKEADLDYEYVTQHVLNDGKMTAEQRLAQLEKRIQEKEAKEAEDKKALAEERVQQVVASFKKDLQTLVNSDEKYELIKTYGEFGVDTVYATIEEHYTETGRILSSQEACDKVEAFFEEEAKKLLSSTKKLRTFVPANDPPKKEESPKSEARPKVTEAPKTLTNNLHANQPTPEKKTLSRDESIAEAAKLLRWTS